jgi:hypothetical protein
VVLRRGEDPLDTGRLRAEPPQADRRWQDRYELLALPVPRQPGQLWLSLDNEAVTIPETLDVLRLVTGTAPDPRAAAAVTDRALGLAGTAAPVPAGVA